MPKNKLAKLSPFASKESALKNITTKIEILETWLRNTVPWEYDAHDQPIRDKDGSRVMVYIPDSLRSFNTWNSGLYSEASRVRIKDISLIVGNGTDTLNKYPHLKQQALSLLNSIKVIASDQLQLEPSNRVSASEQKVRHLELFIENQNRKILDFHRENILLSRNLIATEEREKGNFAELSKNYADLGSENRRLREEISLLTKQLKKIVSLKDVKND